MVTVVPIPVSRRSPLLQIRIVRVIWTVLRWRPEIRELTTLIELTIVPVTITYNNKEAILCITKENILCISFSSDKIRCFSIKIGTLIVSINTIILAKDLYFSGRLWLYAFLPSKKLFWYIFYFFIQWYKIWKWYLF